MSVIWKISPPSSGDGLDDGKPVGNWDMDGTPVGEAEMIFSRVGNWDMDGAPVGEAEMMLSRNESIRM